MKTAPSLGPPPHAMRRSWLGAPPSAAWPQVCHSRFLAAYLGAQLPETSLDRVQALVGSDGQGAPIRLRVTQADAPHGLSLILSGRDGAEALHLSLSACGEGSRLTVLHEPVTDPLSSIEAHRSGDPLQALLSAPLPATLRGGDVADAPALAAAQRFLAGTAEAITELLARMPATAGYAKPSPERFSLAAHAWHLADVETFGWSLRLARVLAEREPVLEGVDGDRLAVERRYQQRPWRGAARRFIAARRRSLAALSRFDAAWLERAVHFGGRRIRVGELIAAMVAHDHEHRLEMAALWPCIDGSEP